MFKIPVVKNYVQENSTNLFFQEFLKENGYDDISATQQLSKLGHNILTNSFKYSYFLRGKTGFNLLIASVQEKEEFITYLRNMLTNCANENNLDIEIDFLGFIEDYFLMSQFLKQKFLSDKIIVDVGCASGIQHILFNGFAGYIGIDPNKGTSEIQPFQGDNVIFLQGTLEQLINNGKLKITDNMVAIANMSLLYGVSGNKQKELEIFNSFHRKIIL